MAKTVKLQGRHAALLLYSASCQTQMTSYHSDSCCLVSGTIMSLRLGAVLNFCRSSLTYSANTLAQSYKQEWRVSPTKHFAATAAGCSKPHLAVLWIGRFLLLQQFHQRFVLVYFSQTDSATHGLCSKLQGSNREGKKCFYL